MMKTLVIDSNLLEEAQMAGQNMTETEIVIRALKEYIQRRKQSQILELFGIIDYDPDYDYKVQRKVK